MPSVQTLTKAFAATLLTGVAATTIAQAQPLAATGNGQDPAKRISNSAAILVPEASGMIAKGEEFAARLKRLDYRELLPMHVTPANFLQEAQKIIKTSSAREIAAMTVEAARLALQIEEIKLGYLKAKLCAGTGLPQLAQYGEEVGMGCKLIDLQQRLTSLQLKGLDMVDEHAGSK